MMKVRCCNNSKRNFTPPHKTANFDCITKELVYILKIQTEFGVSAKQLVKDKGMLSSPDPRLGRQVSKETYDHVVDFTKMMNTAGVCLQCSLNTCSEMPHFVQLQRAVPILQNKVSPAAHWVFQICRAMPEALYSSWGQSMAITLCVFAPYIKM